MVTAHVSAAADQPTGPTRTAISSTYVSVDNLPPGQDDVTVSCGLSRHFGNHLGAPPPTDCRDHLLPIFAGESHVHLRINDLTVLFSVYIIGIWAMYIAILFIMIGMIIYDPCYRMRRSFHLLFFGDEAQVDVTCGRASAAEEGQCCFSPGPW